MTTRKGRAGHRPLSVKNTMHLVLRSSHATGDYSFKKPQTAQKIKTIIKKFSEKYSVQVVSLANVGNHLHFHLKLSNRNSYKPFIRAVSAAIAMAASNTSRWTKSLKDKGIKQFWDYRPFTRIIEGLRAFVGVSDYIKINQLEGLGLPRYQATFFIKTKSLVISGFG